MLAKFGKVSLLLIGLVLAGGAAAQAGQPPHHHGHGHTHDGYGIPGGGHRPHRYHNRAHLDYHPGGYVPHRGHYDYVPGHYDLHRGGHRPW